MPRHRHSTTRPSKEAKLFRNNRSQAVRIPVEFELPGEKVLISRESDRLVIEPIRKAGLGALLANGQTSRRSAPRAIFPKSMMRRSNPRTFFDAVYAGHQHHQ
ncbi:MULTISPECIES: antitoxin [unclassified Mesorhizobium]|uniref:antitoxin n=1 Tax=unclassified Mesorhizobium TaxID=325217 RepID=UPI001D02C6DE|nr:MULTISPECIES: antitoxin [unclassified Mesorhizobium]UCI10806.1 antitoxin [Mesorhizobium sp. B2-1-1]